MTRVEAHWVDRFAEQFELCALHGGESFERLFRVAPDGATMLPWSVEVCLERLGTYGIADPTDGAFA